MQISPARAPTAPPAPARTRRARLAVEANPCRQIDYLVTLRRELADLRLSAGPTGVRIDLHYVPDRCTLSPVALTDYLALMATTTWPTAEALATALFDDLINEVVPRWLTLNLSFAGGQDIILEERQPQWDNPSLLARLPTR